MTSRRARTRSPQAVLALLDDPEFREDARRVIAALAALREGAPRRKSPPKSILELIRPFVEHWRVLPPQTGELLDPEPRRRVVEAIASGNWGILPVFAWTTDREIHAYVT